MVYLSNAFTSICIRFFQSFCHFYYFFFHILRSFSFSNSTSKAIVQVVWYPFFCVRAALMFKWSRWKHHRPPIKSVEQNKTVKERQHYWHIANNITNNNCVYLLVDSVRLYADFQCWWNGLNVYICNVCVCVYERLHEIIKGDRCNTLDWRKILLHPIQCRREKTHHIH